ncbi:uncharacterized protein LOC122686687 [Cervus elaphus]|uniref:uncharacterized protein LOC122686687 n=1 Tax=Cervus elaphus TaxID=9860 RepID=UPI001CC28ADC|nr:uncharacterized protein LOC122686687 [Cervus elaphus]
MDINTNTAAPAGLPRLQQAGCADGKPPGGLGFGGGAFRTPAPGSKLGIDLRASKEILPARRGGASRCPWSHAGSALSKPLLARRPTRAPGARWARSAGQPSARRRGPGTGRVPLGPLGLRPGLTTNFAQVSCAGAAAPLSARSPRSVRPRALRTQSPSGRAFSAGAERAEVQEEGGRVADGWVGFKEGAPSPQFAGPRWGCSQIAPLLQHWGPLSGSGRQPAAPEATGALCTGSGLGDRRVRSAPPSLRTVWLPPPLGSSRPPLPAGAAVVAVLGSSALEEGGAHVEESLARFGGRGDAAQKMLETFPSKKHIF